MPSLRAHAVFLTAVRNALPSWPAPLAEAAGILDSHWPEAVLGTFAPDAWPIYGGTRAEAHALFKEEPATWEGGVERWLVQHAAFTPGGKLSPPESAFVLGYVAHLCLDNWSLYVDPALPSRARSRAPAAWLPASLQDPHTVSAALRAFAEAPIPPARRPSPDALATAPIPAGFHAEAIRQLAVGRAPSFSETDPWRISRISVLSSRPDTPEAHQAWLARRAAEPPLPPTAMPELVDAALDYTRCALERWW